MDDASSTEFSLQEHLVQWLFTVTKSSNLKETLEILIAVSRQGDGRSELASKNILPVVLQLCQNIPYPCGRQYLLLFLKLLRNLCAGEIAHQNSFIALNGVGIVSTVLRSTRPISDPDLEIIRMGLQVLANVSLAGQGHQEAIWKKFFPKGFLALAAVRSRETCDPLCMITYTCCDGIPGLFPGLCGEQGLPIVAEIVRTASIVGFGEDWFKLLVSRICLEEIHFPHLFSRLYCVGNSESSHRFSAEQAYLLRIVSEVLSERISEITISNDFVSCVFGIFNGSVGVIDSVSRDKSSLPTGTSAIDVLGYSLTILRDICARETEIDFKVDLGDAIETLLSFGLLEFLLSLLHNLEPPAIIRKAMRQSEKQETTISHSSKLCPYRGFRRDIVAVIGNCAYGRKHVQDKIRQKNSILLLLQQCVTDEDNPFLREWGIWCVRNLLEGNAENQQAVAELELQRSVDVPELDDLGLRVEVDKKTRRPKLVNVS